MKAVADWSATILVGIFALHFGALVIGWIADRLISAIDWMTRHE